MRPLPDLLARPSKGQLRGLALASALLLAAAIATLVIDSGRGAHRPPTPPAPARALAVLPIPSTSTAVPPAVTPTAIRCRVPHGAGSRGSAPIRICIPSIDVDASVMELGLNADRTVEVPPLSRVGDAGWYRYSAVPGAVGPTVILGHVDSAQYGEGVFFRLGRLRAGDEVAVTGANGSVATFRINSVTEVSKGSFPTQAVYGPTSGPAIRLITCGGPFDSATRNYQDNIIAYGTLETDQP